MSNATQQRFTNLRKRLDQLGYRHPLPLEALPLVERLFNDLIHTTDSLKNARLKLPDPGPAVETIEATTEPYRSDNARLVRENNELHAKLIKQKEEFDISSKELKAALRKLEHESADLRFLNTQYIHKMRSLEEESREKSLKIQQLQERNFEAIIQTPGGEKKPIPFRRQRMEVDSFLPRKDAPPPQPVKLPPAPDPYVADLLRVADDRIQELQSNISQCHDELESYKLKCGNFRKQLENRDAEIERLYGQMDTGRPRDVVGLEAKLRNNERLLAHQNMQIEYLQERNQQLENRIQDMMEETHDATNREITERKKNEELLGEMTSINRIAHEIRHEKERVMDAADQEVAIAKTELVRSQKELENQDGRIERLEREKKNLLLDLEDLRLVLTEKTNESQRLRDIVERTQHDKEKLTHRIAVMTGTERELVMEVERLRKKRPTAVKSTTGKKPVNYLDKYVKDVEQERDYYRGECEMLQRLLRVKGPRSRSASRCSARSPSGSRSPTKARSKDTSPNEKKTLCEFERLIRKLEQERDTYKQQFESMSRSRSQARCCSTSPVREKCALSEAAEMDRCSRENAELRMLMEKYEKHLTELQGSLKTLTTERDRLAQLYDQAKEDLQRARRESINNSKNARICVSTQALLQRVEDERDLALSDLRRIAGERDALKDKLKTTLETCQNERIRIEQKLDEFETMVHNLEAERKECIQRNLSLKDTVLTLEDQLKSLTMQITDSNNQIGDLKAANHALRNSNEDLLHLREDSSRRLNAKENEILSYQDKVIELESRLNDAVRTGQVFKEDVIHLKQTVVSLNSEKEQLQNLVDNKAEKMESLFEDLSMKNRKLDEFTAELRDLENVLSQTQNDLAVREREMKTLRRQLDSYSEDITEVQRCRDSAIRENERLQEDLTLLTKENQALRHDLEEFAVDRAGLRQQVQDYINEVGRAEGMLSEKEQERTDLLNQYKEQNVELTRMKNTILELEGEVAQIQYELGSKSKENRRMHELAEQFERETRQARDAQQNAEMQLSNCNRDLQRAEETIQRLDTENTNIMKDMAALREICSKLNCTKEDLSRTLGKKTLDNEEMHNLLAELKAEVELLRNQLGAERANAKSLEGIIATFREKEFQQELCSQEKSAEIQLLRDRMTLNDTKSGNQGRELSNLRSRALELEAEVDRLRRQLTNERFERERAAQELRRHGITPPPVADSSLCMNHAHSPSRSARLAGHGTNTNRDRDRDYYP